MSVRLTWSGAESLDDGIRTMLLGPGGPFEMATEEVLGVEASAPVKWRCKARCRKR